MRDPEARLHQKYRAELRDLIMEFDLQLHNYTDLFIAVPQIAEHLRAAKEAAEDRLIQRGNW